MLPEEESGQGRNRIAQSKPIVELPGLSSTNREYIRKHASFLSNPVKFFFGFD